MSSFLKQLLQAQSRVSIFSCKRKNTVKPEILESWSTNKKVKTKRTVKQHCVLVLVFVNLVQFGNTSKIMCFETVMSDTNKPTLKSTFFSVKKDRACSDF